MDNMAEAAKQVFGPGGVGFIITLLVIQTVAEFIAEHLFRATNPMKVIILKASGNVGSVLLFLGYLGLLLAKYATFTTTGHF